MFTSMYLCVCVCNLKWKCVKYGLKVSVWVKFLSSHHCCLWSASFSSSSRSRLSVWRPTTCLWLPLPVLFKCRYSGIVPSVLQDELQRREPNFWNMGWEDSTECAVNRGLLLWCPPTRGEAAHPHVHSQGWSIVSLCRHRPCLKYARFPLLSISSVCMTYRCNVNTELHSLPWLSYLQNSAVLPFLGFLSALQLLTHTLISSSHVPKLEPSS